MIDDQIHVAIKSYKRPGRVITLSTIPFAHVWVPESQADDYRSHYGDRVISIPDELDGNLPRKLNAILDRSPCPWTLILDDDISHVGCFEDGEHKRHMDPDHIRWLILHGFDLASQLGVTLWGIQQNQDTMLYQTNKPFNLLSPILGPWGAHLSPTIRYDETVPYKEDYDFWLQTLYHHRRTLRLNKYHYVHDHGKMPGGQVSMRTMATELENIKRLQAKWGTRIVTPGGSAGGKSASGKNILNTRVRHPIPGC